MRWLVKRVARGRSGGASARYPGTGLAIIAAIAAASMTDTAAAFSDDGGVPGLLGWPQDYALRLSLYLIISVTSATLVTRVIFYGVRQYTVIQDKYLVLGLVPISFGLSFYCVFTTIVWLLAEIQPHSSTQTLFWSLIFLLSAPLVFGTCLMYIGVVFYNFFSSRSLNRYLVLFIGSIVIIVEVLYFIYITNLVE